MVGCVPEVAVTDSGSGMFVCKSAVESSVRQLLRFCRGQFTMNHSDQDSSTKVAVSNVAIDW